MSYTLVLEWMPGDLYMSAVTARCTAPTSSYSVVWLPPNKVYQITLYCGSTSLVSFLVGAFRGKAWSYMSGTTKWYACIDLNNADISFISTAFKSLKSGLSLWVSFARANIVKNIVLETSCKLSLSINVAIIIPITL